MRLELIALAVCLMVAGGIFALQGLNVLPGSFMTGRPEWTLIGTLGVLAGAVLLALVRRGKAS